MIDDSVEGDRKPVCYVFVCVLIPGQMATMDLLMESSIREWCGCCYVKLG